MKKVKPRKVLISNGNILDYYDERIQRIIIKGHEYEVNKSTGELTPLCYWLSHDTCILENICCDGKGRCKYIMKEGE